MMKKVTLVAMGATIGLMAGTAVGATLWDNGPPDGSNGYSNGTVNAFGIRRSLMDDFVLDRDSVLQDFHWEHIWNAAPPGSGTGLVLDIRSDAGGTPGNVIASANITGYSEMATGVTFFNRDGAESWATFDDLALGAGTYWIDATIIGPENNFWLVRTEVTGSELWINYDDLGFDAGSNVFGVAADLNFVLTGVPAPGALALLGLAGLAGTRRRRA